MNINLLLPALAGRGAVQRGSQINSRMKQAVLVVTIECWIRCVLLHKMVRLSAPVELMVEMKPFDRHLLGHVILYFLPETFAGYVIV